MKSRLTGANGSDRMKGTGVKRINHATGEEVCYILEETLYMSIHDGR